MAKLEPYKSQPVLDRAIAGDEYAAIITDVREDGCDVSTFPPWGRSTITTAFTRIKYFESRADAKDFKGAACYPAV